MLPPKTGPGSLALAAQKWKPERQSDSSVVVQSERSDDSCVEWTVKHYLLLSGASFSQRLAPGRPQGSMASPRHRLPTQPHGPARREKINCKDIPTFGTGCFGRRMEGGENNDTVKMWPLISLEGLRCRRGPMVLFA